MEQTTENLQLLVSRAVQMHQQGHLAEAMSLYRRVLAIDCNQPQVHSNLGVIQRALGQIEAAEASYRKAIAIKPDFADAHTNLANLIKRTNPTEALSHYERAIALTPGEANIYYNYAATLLDIGRAWEAAEAYQRAIAIRPKFAEAWCNLGVALADLNRLQEAIDAYHSAIALRPELVQAYSNLGLALQEQGLSDEAIAAFDKAVALAPNQFEYKANRIFAELYRPGVGLRKILRLSQQPAGSAHSTGALFGKTGRPRLGFVSADFRQHAVGRLVLPSLEGLRRLGFEIICYSNSPRSDALTARFMDAATTWRPVWGLSDEKLDAQIRADEIGILFDLSGYSRGNRLRAFARKPAPIQIAWAGYPATTGLPSIDYLITDHWQTPTGSDEFYTEELLRLSRSYICFSPPGEVPEPGDLPALRNGFVTFGSFNALKKINGRVIQTWSRIISDIPQARLLLKSPAFDCAKTREMTIARFDEFGVTRQRLEFFGASSSHDHMAAMARADVALDTFPYSGGMSTLEMLWMGLPVITWPDETIASRHSFGYLNTIGLGELAAQSADGYVNLAETLAGDFNKLADLRRGMRTRILSSPLTDQSAFCVELAKNLESIFQLHSSGKAMLTES